MLHVNGSVPGGPGNKRGELGIMAAEANEAVIMVRLEAILYGARSIHMYVLRREDGFPLPSCEPGAHIDVHLPSGMTRQYSLMDPGANPDHYQIGVKCDPNSRGGSRYMHEELRVGSMLPIGLPRNNFPLVKNASHIVLIAGGIGMTPIWSMWQWLKDSGVSHELYYACRTRGDAMFLGKLSEKPNVHLHFDDENDGKSMDINGVVSKAPEGSHLYCCGPAPMLDAFTSATVDWPPDQIHIESFAANAPAATDGGFVVELARAKREVTVAPGQTILEALRTIGVQAPSSCEEGLCGACMTKVLSGAPDHRDSVLTETERASNTKIMICCSGSKSDRIVLDL